jgi:hypothetical protein
VQYWPSTAACNSFFLESPQLWHRLSCVNAPLFSDEKRPGHAGPRLSSPDHHRLQWWPSSAHHSSRSAAAANRQKTALNDQSGARSHEGRSSGAQGWAPAAWRKCGGATTSANKSPDMPPGLRSPIAAHNLVGEGSLRQPDGHGQPPTGSWHGLESAPRSVATRR